MRHDSENAAAIRIGKLLVYCAGSANGIAFHAKRSVTERPG